MRSSSSSLYNLRMFHPCDVSLALDSDLHRVMVPVLPVFASLVYIFLYVQYVAVGCNLIQIRPALILF